MATFVLIHGACDAGWYWHLTAAELHARGHQTIAPDLPCDNDTASLDDYAATVADAAGGRPDLVIVGQSYGAFTATLAASQLPARLLVLLAGMIQVPGESPGQWWSNTGYRQPAGGRPAMTAARPATTTRSSVSATACPARWPRRPCKGAGAGNHRQSGEFDRHYREVHIPLTKKLQGLRRYTISRNVAPIRGGKPYYLIATLDWDDMAALHQAVQSPEGRAT